MSSMSDKWVVHNTGIQTNESTSQVRKSSSSQKVPKITASLYLLFPWYRVPFSNPHLGIQDILVGIMPVTRLQKFQHCWWAFGRFQNLWEKKLSVCVFLAV